MHSAKVHGVPSLEGYTLNPITATRGAEDAGSKDVRMLFHEVGLASGKMNATAGDEALEDERTTYTRTGEKQPGFASAAVPTLEERVIEDMAGTDQLNRPSGKDSEGRTGTGQLYGEPADARSGDAEPPHGAGSSLSPEEEKAPAARSIIREHLTAGEGNNPWAALTPTPEVDPKCFDDPLSDAFWKDTWLAIAVHNVR
jgi:phospholipase D1/2